MIYIKVNFILCLLIQHSNISSACPEGMKLFVDEDGLPECFSCRECPEGTTKVENCTYKHDTICEICSENEYYDDRSLHCRKCAVCDDGYYVRRKCSTFKDTKCDVCPSGTMPMVQDPSNDCRGTTIDQECSRTKDIVCKQTGEDIEKQHVTSYIEVIVIPLSVVIFISALVLMILRHRRNGHHAVFKENQPFLTQPNGTTEITDNDFQDFRKYLKSIYRSMLSAHTDVIFGEPYAEFNMTSKTLENPEPREVKHAKDIFNENGNTFKRICVIGDASIGKTTLCRSILHDYCCSDAPEKDSLTHDNEFDWYFFISLRHFNSKSNILDMIKCRYFQNHGHLLPQILEKGERILVILDDFDKMKIPQDSNEGNAVSLDISIIDDLQNCTILITTRPLALINLKSSERLLECDREITIKNITRTAATNFIRAVFKKWNNVENGEKVEPYIDDLRITTHPLLLKQLVRLYCKTEIPKHPEEPLCETFGKIVLSWFKDVNFIDETANHCEQLLPECLKTEMQDHKLLLSLLGKVSFDILIKHDSSYFYLGTLIDVGLSESIIESCQNIGLLSLGLDSCVEPDDTTIVSFPHRLYLDYFAAVHLFMNPGAVDTLLEKCNTANQIMSFRYVLLFLSGMNSSSMNSVFNMMNDMLDNETVADRIALGDISLLNIQSLALDCVGEQQQSTVSLQNIYISLDVFNGNITVNANSFLKSLQKCYALQSATLDLHESLDNIKEGLLLKVIEMKHNTLTTLILKGSGCTPYFEYFHCGKVLKLTHLQISDIELSHADKQMLMTGVAKTVGVQELVLVDIKCKDHDQCPCPLELIQCSMLKKLILKQIQLGWVSVNTSSLTDCIEADIAVFYSPATEKFKSSTELKLKNVISPYDVDAYALLLPSLCELLYLEVSMSDFGNKDVCLSKKAVNLKMIKLTEVNMSNEKLIQFINSIPEGANKIVCVFYKINHLHSAKDICSRFEVTSYEDCRPCGQNIEFKAKSKFQFLKIFNRK